jgi:hypothetical protein
MKHIALKYVIHIFVNVFQHGIDFVVGGIEDSARWLRTILVPWLLVETDNQFAHPVNRPPIPSSTYVTWSVQFRNNFDSCGNII